MKRASACAKINLALLVGPRRDDGLHEVVTVLQRIDLADRLELEPAHENSVSGFAEDTLVKRALDLVSADTNEHWRAKLEKRIPVSAGLGGGSSDAASTLLALNRLWELDWPVEQLLPIGATVGADVPFFLGGRNAFVAGIGERLAPAEVAPAWH